MRYTMKHKIAAATLTAALLFGPVAALPAPSAYAAQAAEVQWGVNMRTSPSTSGSVIRMLKKGEQITVLEQSGSSWYKISDANGKTGYISSSSQYTKLLTGSGSNTGSGSGSGNSSQGQASMNAVAKKSVSFRTGPSTSNSLIRYIKAGEQVRVTAKTNSYWYEVVDASGVKGYVTTQTQYLNVTGTIPSGSTGSGSSGGSGSNGGTGNTGGSTAPATNASVEKVIAAGMKYLGTPYQYGSDRNSTAFFDCSAFVRRAFLDGLGVTLPADSRQQGAYVKNKGNATTDISKLKRGDLMFFMSYKGTSAASYKGINKANQAITHVAIYLGDGQVLHTYSKESGGVRTNSIKNTHWEYRFIFGGSAL